MLSPQFDNVRGTTSGTPGTGSFTPNAAATGYRAWSNVPPPFFGVIRFDDGSSWELRYCYWDGTAISRPTAGFIDSSSGSGPTLTSSATAMLAASCEDIEPSFCNSRLQMYIAEAGNNVFSRLGFSTSTNQGTATSITLATTNFLTEQTALKFTSNTLANNMAGANNTAAPCAVYSTSAGRGGFEFGCRFGASQLPTGPRLFVGMTSATMSTSDPSSLSADFAVFGKDAADTNIQLMTSTAGTSGKTDTGIPLTANGFYLAKIWALPGGGKVYGLLVRLDTGDIWFGSRTANMPTNGAMLFPDVKGALNGTNTGTAFIMHIAAMTVRNPV